MSVLNPTRQRVRLGEDYRQALGMWPIKSGGAGLGSTGAAQVKTVPTTYLIGYQSGKAAPTQTAVGGGGGRGPSAAERRLIQQV